MKKRLLSLVLCLVMVFSLLPMASLAVTGDEVAADGTYTGTANVTDSSDTDTITVTVTVSGGNITALSGSYETWNDGYAQNAAAYLMNKISASATASVSTVQAISIPSNASYSASDAEHEAAYADINGAKQAVIAALGTAPEAEEELGPNEKYIYTQATPSDPSKGWTTDDDYTTTQYYAYIDSDGDGTYEYVPVKPSNGTFYPSAGNSWTAQSARDWVVNNDDLLYFWNGSEYETVYVSKEVRYYYKNTNGGGSDCINLSTGDRIYHSLGAGNNYKSGFYMRDPSDTYTDWHELLYTENGRLNLGQWGYYYTFYYYTHKVTGNTFTAGKSARAGSTGGSGDSQYKYLNDYESLDVWGALGEYTSGYYYHTAGDGYLYEAYEATDTYNYMYTNSRVLASQEPNSTQSETFNHDLYYETTAVEKLTYGNGTTLGTVATNKGDVIYTGPLYTRTIGVKGQLEGFKSLSERNDDGRYDLTIDSWATGSYQGETEAVIPGQSSGGDEPGSEIVKRVTAKQPLDIVLVLDQSGSMATPDMDESKQAVSTGKTEWTLSELESGSYYYNVNGKMYPVKLGQGTIYSESTSKIASWMFGYGHDGISVAVNGAPVYYNVSTNHFIKYDADGDGQDEMHRIFMVTSGLFLHYGLYPYVYNDANDDYTKKSQWTDNHYWVAVFNPWTAKKLRNNDQWNILTDGNGGENSRISYINTNGQTTGATDADGDNAKLSYSWITDSGRINNVYKASGTGTTYLYYVNDAGEEVPISNTRLFRSEKTFTTNEPLWKYEAGTRRVAALKAAVEEFVNTVQTNQSADEAGLNAVTHRIAMVGFAGNKVPSYGGDPSDKTVLGANGVRDYSNTGLFKENQFENYGTLDSVMDSANGDHFINRHYYTDAAGTDAVYYDGEEWVHALNPNDTTSIDTSALYKPTYSAWLDNNDYKTALKNANSVTVPSFGCYGGTYTSYGLAMANQIFENNPLNDTTKEEVKVAKKADGSFETEMVQRKRVIIVFTDGEPGGSGYEEAIANEALAGGAEAKGQDNDNRAVIYTVGLYPGKVSSQVEQFMKQLSSEYTAQLEDVYSESNLAVDTKLDGKITYYYTGEDGKVYSVAAKRYGESTLGWWAKNNGVYIQLTPKGKNALSGEDQLYKNGQKVYGEDLDSRDTYDFYYDGKTWEVRFEYRWYDPDGNIITPKTDPNSSGTQLMQIVDQKRNDDGEKYYMTASNASELNSVFTSISTLITQTDGGSGAGSSTPLSNEYAYGPEALVYNEGNSVIRDVISDEFDVPENPNITLTLVEGQLNSKGKFEPTGETLDVTNDENYTKNWDPTSKEITVTGYDFSENFVSETHTGWIMRVTINGLSPKAKTGTVLSNNKGKSGIYAVDGDTVGEKLYTYNNPDAELGPYTVTWMNDGKAIEIDNVNFNDSPVYYGEEPTKTDDDYIYHFKGWSAEEDGSIITNFKTIQVRDNVTYYAVYDRVEKNKQYTVKWHNVDGVVLGTDNMNAGQFPSRDSTDVTIAKDEFFVGWTTDTNNPMDHLYFGSETVDKLAGNGTTVDFYAVTDKKPSIEPESVMVEYGTKNIISEDVYAYSVETVASEKDVDGQTVIGEKPMENAGRFSLTYSDKGNVGTFAFTPMMEESQEGTYDLTPLKDVSKAYYYLDENYKNIKEVTVVAGSSIYFDDSLKEVSSARSGNRFNYEASLGEDGVNENDTKTFKKGETMVFKFSGERIDIYCTTDGTPNSVLATIKHEDGTTATDANGKTVSAKLSANKLANGGTLYNTPTVSFDNLDINKTYVVTIKAMTEQYRFDGIRVYNPKRATDVSSVLVENSEQNAHYQKVRDILITGKEAFDKLDDGTEAVLFVDKVGFDGGTATFGDYKDYGPKNEVYLAPGQGIAFAVDTSGYVEPKVSIGLSSQSMNGKVNVSNGAQDGSNVKKLLEIKSVTDQYYAVAPFDNGIVIIQNADTTGNNLIAVSNIKITGDKVSNSMESNAPLAMKKTMVRSALASFNGLEIVEDVSEPTPTIEPTEEPSEIVEPEETPSEEPTTEPVIEPTAEPTVEPSTTVEPSNGNTNIISRIIKSISNTISKLFGKLFRR